MLVRGSTEEAEAEGDIHSRPGDTRVYNKAKSKTVKQISSHSGNAFEQGYLIRQSATPK